jgi:dipeptidyl aminopeptidase/acylaminoacyl peptidase
MRPAMSRLIPAVLGLLLLPHVLSAQRTSTAPGFEYFRPPDFERPLVSPGGQFVGFIARADQHARLYRLVLATGKLEGVFDPGDGEILSYWWIDDARVLICGYGKYGRTYFVHDLQTQKTRDVPTLNKANPWALRPVPGDHERIVAPFYEWGTVSMRDRYLATIDLKSGREKRIGAFAGGDENAISSATGELRSQAWLQGDTWYVQWRESSQQPWQEIKGTQSLPSFLPVAMDADDRHLLVIAFDQGDTSALMRLDPATGQRTLVAQKPAEDVLWTMAAPDEGTIQGVTFFDLEQEAPVFLDPGLGDLHRKLQNSLPEKNCRIVSRSADGKIFVVANWATGQPWTYYLFANGRLSQLGQERSSPKGKPFGRTQAFTFMARDGFQGRGYVVVPPDASGPVPLIVLAPGFVGENIGIRTQYDSATQYFVSRGFAVASVAVRSQTGMGRKFEDAGYAKPGLALEDMEDGVRDLADRKVIDPSRVGIMGTGNRALLALRAATTRPLYRAVIVHNPVTDLEATYSYWFGSHLRPQLNLVQLTLGTMTAWQLMRQFDPANSLSSLQAPLLLVCDGSKGLEAGYLINRAASIRRQLEKNKLPHEWYVADEPSEWRSDEVYLFELNQRIATFLEQQLKPGR